MSEHSSLRSTSTSSDTYEEMLRFDSSETNSRVFETQIHFGYRTSSDRGIASSFKELMERFENAQICGSIQGEWKSFKTREEATSWAFGKESNPSSPAVSSVKSDLMQEVERKTKLFNDSQPAGSVNGYATLYSNDEKWAPTLTQGAAPAWGTSSKTVFVDADGACPKNGRRGALGGIGVYFGPNDPRNLSEPLPGHPQTNQRAELMSLIRAVEILQREGKRSSPVCLRSDSRYAVSGLTEWVPKWKRNGWTTARGTEVKNQDLWRTLDADILQLGQLRRVHLVWVKAHAGDRRNEEADRLATEGVRKAEAMRQRLLASLPCLPSNNAAQLNLSPLRRPIQSHTTAVNPRSFFALDKNPGPITVGNTTRKPLTSSLFSFDQKLSVGNRSVW